MLNSDFINLNNDFSNFKYKHEIDMNNQSEQNYSEQNDPETVSCFEPESQLKYKEVYYGDKNENEFYNSGKVIELISCVDKANGVSINNSMLDSTLTRFISEAPLLVNS